MARSRNIKPSIMDNEELAEMGALHRLLFIYLWMLADREGRLEDRPKRIAVQALPYDRDADVDAMLKELEGAGFISRYTTDGVAVIQILAFAKHQAPHVRESASSLPAQVHETAKDQPEHYLGSAKVVTGRDLGGCEASPRSPDSGFLIPDSLIPEPGFTDSAPTGEARAAPSLGVPFLTRNGVNEQTARDWLKVRKAKKAPLTETAWDELCREADKAGISPAEAVSVCARRSWQGFNSTWNWRGDEAQMRRAGPPTLQSTADRDAKARALLFGNKSHGSAEVIDV